MTHHLISHLHSLLSLHYEFFLAHTSKYHYQQRLSTKTKEDLKKQLSTVKEKLTEFDIERANEYAHDLKSKWTSWDIHNPHYTPEVHDSNSSHCYWDPLEDYKEKMIKIYKNYLKNKE